MKIVTSPSRHTLGKLELEPESGLGEFVSGNHRRGSALAWHLNRRVLALAGGTGNRPWLGNLSGFCGFPLADFRQRLQTLHRAVDDVDADETIVCGWEFALTAGLWQSSDRISGIYLVHAGFEEECRQLAIETGLPVGLTESLLRSWLLTLYRGSSGCGIVLISLHDDETAPQSPEELVARDSGAEDLAESEMNAADPLPRGVWRLQKGGWDVVATNEDFEVAGALQQLGRLPNDAGELSLAFGWDPSQRAAPVSVRTYRDTRNIELRAIDRLTRERTRRASEREAAKETERNRLYGKLSSGRPSFQPGRYFRYLLKRIFSRKPSS